MCSTQVAFFNPINPTTFRTGSKLNFRSRTEKLYSRKVLRAVGSLDTASTETVQLNMAKVGWIGTGVMGAPMCGHILRAGFSTTVYTRTASKAEVLISQGASLAETPKEVASKSDVVFLIVGYPADVRSVVLGEDGVLAGLKPGGVVVDMTTSEPSLAKEIAERARQQGCEAVDAPVSGGDVGAKNGTLSIMAGGSETTVQEISPMFSALGKVTYMGPAGSGQSCKMANQVTIATTMIGLVEGMLYAHKAGLDLDVYLTAIRSGAAGSKSLELYSSRILQGDMKPGFMVKHFVKDLGIALRECQGMQLALPGLALAQQLYTSLEAHNEGDCGTQALVHVLERMNSTALPKNRQ